jgi:hypothetical protein
MQKNCEEKLKITTREMEILSKKLEKWKTEKLSNEDYLCTDTEPKILWKPGRENDRFKTLLQQKKEQVSNNNNFIPKSMMTHVP